MGAYLERGFDVVGWVDLGRVHGGAGLGAYAWWSWRGEAFDSDAGWRFDYELASAVWARPASDAESSW